MNRDILLRLRQILANLYSDTTSIRRILYDSEIDTSRIRLDSSPINVWHMALDHADKQHKIESLLEVVLREEEYGANKELQKILDDLQQSLKDNSEINVEESTFAEPEVMLQPHLNAQAEFLANSESLLILRAKDFEPTEEINGRELLVARSRVKIQCQLPISLNDGKCTIEFSNPFLRNVVIELNHDDILQKLLIGRHIPVEWNGRRFFRLLDDDGYLLVLNGFKLVLSETDASDLCECVDFMLDAYISVLMDAENTLEAWDYPLQRIERNTYGYEIAIISPEIWKRMFSLAKKDSSGTEYAIYTNFSEIHVETSVITHTRLTAKQDIVLNGLAQKQYVSVICMTPEYDHDLRSIGSKGWWTVPQSKKWLFQKFASILEESSLEDYSEPKNNPLIFNDIKNANDLSLHVYIIHRWIMVDSYGNLPTAWFIEFCEAYRLLVRNSTMDLKSNAWDYVLSHLPIREMGFVMPQRYQRKLLCADITDILSYNVSHLQQEQYIDNHILEFTFRGYEVLLREIKVDTSQLSINRFKRALWPLFEKANFESRFSRLGLEI